MSLAEILDNGAPHPWANLRINDEQIDGDLTVEGSTTHVGPVIYSGNVTVTGDLTVNPGKIITDVIQMTPGADLVILPNGGPNVFDVQTAISRSNALETDSIDCKTPASALQIGGSNCNAVNITESLFLPTTGGTASGLNYYEKGTFTVSMGGCYTPDHIFNFNFERIGGIVSLYWDEQLFNCDVTSGMTFSGSDGWPLNLRPGIHTECVLPGTYDASGPATTIGILELDGADSGTIWNSPAYDDGGSAGLFQMGGSVGLRIGCTFYKIAN